AGGQNVDLRLHRTCGRGLYARAPLRVISLRITIRPMFTQSQIGRSLALAITLATSGLAQGTRTRFHLEEATIAGIQGAIRGGQVTTVGLVELYLKRIKAYNGTCVNEPQGILGPITTIPNAGDRKSTRLNSSHTEIYPLSPHDALPISGLVELYLKRIKAYNGTCVNEPQGILGPITTIANAGDRKSTRLNSSHTEIYPLSPHDALPISGLVELYLKRIKAYNGTCVNEPQGILGPITTIANA